MNYFDILLAKKLEDDRDPKVEGLSVTENGRYHEDGVVYDPVIVNVPETPLSKLTVTQNGTYTAPSGTAYSEVDVDVPLPSNAYLLKEIEDVEIASFNDGSDLSMPKLEVGIEPVQEGSGDPSPTNIRPISGWDEVNVTVADDTTDPTTENVYTLDLDGTRYGGKVDLVSGVMTVDRASIKLSDLIWTKQNTANNNWRFKSSQSIQNIKIPTGAAYKIDNLCSVYRNVTANETWTADDTGIAINADASLFICDLNQADTTALGVVIANQTIVYELATPITIQLSPTVVKSLRGMNNVFADSGNILDLSYLAKEE
jgi:hypothetical protein